MIRSVLMIVFLMLVPGLFSQEIDLEDELILYLPFNGNSLDESGNSISTAPDGPVLTYDRHGNPEQALQFDGVNDYIALNNNEALITEKQFSICMWAKIDGRSHAAFGKSNSLFEQRDQERGSPVSIHFDAELNGETMLGIRSSISDGSLVLKCNYPGDDIWCHFAGTMDEERNLSIFINGKLQISGTFPNEGDFSTGVSSVKIGTHNPEYQIEGAFHGALDEIYIYNRALKACEIEALYSGQLLEER